MIVIINISYCIGLCIYLLLLVYVTNYIKKKIKPDPIYNALHKLNKILKIYISSNDFTKKLILKEIEKIKLTILDLE